MITIKTVTKTIGCNGCQEVSVISMPVKGWTEWREGALIQDALPTLSPVEREMLISGICGACFAEIFGEDK